VRDMEDDNWDDIEDTRLGFQDLKQMQERFVAYLARLDERINLAAAKETAAVANDQEEIDWLEKHVAHAEAPREMAEMEALDDPEERMFRRMEKGLEPDLTFNEAVFPDGARSERSS
jgi:hypothetical protein